MTSGLSSTSSPLREGLRGRERVLLLQLPSGRCTCIQYPREVLDQVCSIMLRITALSVSSC